jgi:hypothetical protein
MGLFNSFISDSIATDAFTLTPDDATGLIAAEGGNRIPAVRALFIATGGTLHFRTQGGIDRTITVPNNFMFECAISRVYATGTSAANITAYV